MLRAGRLRNRIDIEKTRVTRDSRGGETDSWYTLISSVPCAFIQLTGREYYAAQQEFADVDIRVEMHYHRGVDETCRVKYGGKYYDIVAAIDVDSKHRELNLMLRKQKNV